MSMSEHNYNNEKSLPIRAHLEAGLEHTEGDLVDHLLGRFPEELQDRLSEEIEEFTEPEAIEYLTTKLTNRLFTLRDRGIDHLRMAGVEIGNEDPLSFLQNIETSRQAGPDAELGNGKNGEVLRSLLNRGSCIKALFLERAQQLASTAAREALLQQTAARILTSTPSAAQVPKVMRFIDHKDVRAIQMEEIDGVNLASILDGENPFPEGFDIDVFFEKLEMAIEILNENGLFHRDLLNNAGNVMIDKGGNPWVIDFGRAIRSADSEHSGRTYQVYPGGPFISATDKAGVVKLKQKVRLFVSNHNG